MTYYSRLLARADFLAGGPGNPGVDLVSELAAALRVAVAERDAARTSRDAARGAIDKCLYRDSDGKVRVTWLDDVDMLTEIGLTAAEAAEVDAAVVA